MRGLEEGGGDSGGGVRPKGRRESEKGSWGRKRRAREDLAVGNDRAARKRLGHNPTAETGHAQTSGESTRASGADQTAQSPSKHDLTIHLFRVTCTREWTAFLPGMYKG